MYSVEPFPWFNGAMQHLLRMWYVQSAPWAFQRYLSTVRTFDGTFAVGDTWKNMGRPLFQDYTWQGRLIGIFLRLGRIFVGGITYLLTGCIFVTFYLVWLAFPLLCIASIVGGFIGPSMGGS